MFIKKSTRRKGGKVYTNYRLVESYRTPQGPRQRTICALGDLRPRPRRQWLNLVRQVEDALVGQQALDRQAGQSRDEVETIVDRIRQRAAARGPSDPAAPASARPPTSSEAKTAQRPPDDTTRVSVRVDQITTEQHREAGPVHVGHQFWQRLELDRILADVGLRQPARQLACAMVLNRLIAPKAELAMPDWIRSTALEDILEVDFSRLNEDHLYRMLDTLHPHRATIESELVERERTLFNLDATIVLYDVTSTYFEGTACANPKAKYGYSRDKRPDCKQVVIGLVVNRDGFPMAHEVLEGNVQDRKTLDQMLDQLDARVGLKAGQTVVVDRGMAYPENIAQIKQRGLHYIVATRQAERHAWLDDFEDDTGFEAVLRAPSPRNPSQNKPVIRVKRAQRGEESFVLCHSAGRIEKDRAIRRTKEARLLADLDKLQTRIHNGRLVQPQKIGEAIGRLKERYPTVARYYTITYLEQEKQLTYGENSDLRARAEALDGTYLLKTDRHDLTADEAWRIYSMLTQAEDAFRDMKSPLSERPIFHHLEHRVETHIFLCVLAYHLLVAVEKMLLDQGIHTSWATIRDALKTHQVCTIVLPTDAGPVLRIRKGSIPEPPHQALYDRLAIPYDVLPPRKTWALSSPHCSADNSAN